MKPSKSIPLAVTVVIIAVASIIAPIAITESWFSDEDSADITISVSVLKIEKIGDDESVESTEFWNGNSVKTLEPGKYNLSPAISGASVTIYINDPSKVNPSNSSFVITGPIDLTVNETVNITLSQEALNQVSQ